MVSRSAPSPGAYDCAGGAELSLGGNCLDQVAYLALVEVPGDIGLADHANQVVPVDDRHTPNLVLFHRTERHFN